MLFRSSDCFGEQAQKDREAAEELRKTRQLLEDAKVELQNRNKEALGVAAKYRHDLDELKRLVEAAPDDREAHAIFSCRDLRNVFGSQADLSPYLTMSKQQILDVLNGYDQGYDRAFTRASNESADQGSQNPPNGAPAEVAGNASTISGMPSQAYPLGATTQELADANKRAGEALRMASLSMPGVDFYSNFFVHRADHMAQEAGAMANQAAAGAAAARRSTISETIGASSNALTSVASLSRQISRPGESAVNGTSASRAAPPKTPEGASGADRGSPRETAGADQTAASRDGYNDPAANGSEIGRAHV